MFFRRKPSPPPAEPVLPEGMRVYAIGDVHGELALLRDLLAHIEADNAARPAADTRVVMLGDLVDRGPDSAGVVELLLNQRPGFATFHFLAGNHEDAMLTSLAHDADPRESGWLRFGGHEALASYGVPEDVFELHGAQLSYELRRYVPEEHLRFIEGFEEMLVLGGYLFVHAGIRPGRSLERQSRGDLLWIREGFLEHEGSHGLMVVHGHTVRREPDFAGNRIGIDTGAYATGVLTALALEGREQRVIQAAMAR
ncbi:metallophosphoesterase family protein [Sphingomonas canadensis]|uniref:Metallophosphoesterase family protein n=1 Tax=Sphingomonas canadensis TaxID=1219257 RepID=A0ABW3HC77_9SPHN|nr:metallophosphoesterase family protein [Sphingomonas canadensis]MCW3837104.1 serine/threonine protein phosphatase [Sphingomonas canadensis]